MSTQIGQAYPLIVDKSGNPLDDGIVYIGESGQNPENYLIQIYYDEDFTIPAPQPLRTINGYFSRNGSPAKIFINAVECSIVVKDRFEILQWSDLNYTGVLSGKGIKASDVIDESGKSQQEINDLLNVEIEKYRYPALYAKNLKTDGTDQLDELNALAAEAVSKKLELILPLGTITVRDEFIPPDRLKMSSISTVATWSASHTGTIIKWGGSNGIGKSVIRCSRSPIGITPTQAITAVELNGIHVDATGCDYGAYFRYFTNESRVKNLVVRNSNKCNIWGGQLWFSWFDQLTSMTAQDKGTVFGIPLAGEVGDLAVNAINFPYIRSHSSGQAGTYDATTNPDGGCGFLFNTQACSYGLIQSESNGGSGVINRSNSRENTLNGMYLENNCQTDTVNTLKNAYVQDSGSTATPVTLHGVTLAANQVIYNKGTITPIYIGDLIPIDRTYQCLNGQVGSAGFSFIGFESPALEGMSADEQLRLIKHTSRSYYDLYDINLRYTSQISNVKLRTLHATEYVHLVIIPKVSATGAFTFTLNFAGQSFSTTITDPIAGQSYRIRRPTLSKGVYTLTITTGTTVDFIVDIIIASGFYGNTRPARYLNI